MFHNSFGELLKPLIRVYWWFTGRRLDYRPYYAMARVPNLPQDPRAIRRGKAKGFLAFGLCIYLVCAIATGVIEYELNFDPQLGVPVLNIISSFVALIFFTATFAFKSYPNAVLGAQIIATFVLAWKVVAYGLLVSFGVKSSVTSMSSRDTSYLPDEEGTQRWAYPEELTDSRGTLLPDGYDLFFGFDAQTAAAMKESRKRISADVQPDTPPLARLSMLVVNSLTGALAALVTLTYGTHRPADFVLTLAAGAAFGAVFAPRLPQALHLQLTGLGATLGAILGTILGHALTHNAWYANAGIGAGFGTIIAIAFTQWPSISKGITSTRQQAGDITFTEFALCAVVAAAVAATGYMLHEPLWHIVIASLGTVILAMLEFRLLIIALAVALAAGGLIVGLQHRHMYAGQDAPLVAYFIYWAVAATLSGITIVSRIPIRQKASA